MWPWATRRKANAHDPATLCSHAFDLIVCVSRRSTHSPTHGGKTLNSARSLSASPRGDVKPALQVGENSVTPARFRQAQDREREKHFSFGRFFLVEKRQSIFGALHRTPVAKLPRTAHLIEDSRSVVSDYKMM
jgi:hypothetical protein